MNLHPVIPVLSTNRMSETIEFYTGKLGFNVLQEAGNDADIQQVQLGRDQAAIMFLRGEQMSTPRLKEEVYIDCVNVEDLLNEFSRRANIHLPLQKDETGRKFFSIKDNNGYVLSFGQVPSPQTPFQVYFPSSFTLETPRVLLRPMQMEDLDSYAALAGHSQIWTYFSKDLSDRAAMQQWMIEALADKFAEKRMPFTVIDKDTKQICGSTSYGNISFFDSRLEIGWSWLGLDSMGTGVNRQAKFALLSFAFEVMKMERVEIKTDNLNERAKAALLKVGMIPEGILRSHMQMHSNRRRDSIYFSIIRNEWEERKALFFSEFI
jgi:N-acetyltransferase